ncbi:hypothetical protein M514_14781 [Trichuris suis]|uniref:Uncharacterized protein n=1 Tax=Trichuris suis TaxID=68888 RepID=A0A085NTT1_9BILA|nr:hypothetical protein M514_14781 [Trichuris suis]
MSFLIAGVEDVQAYLVLLRCEIIAGQLGQIAQPKTSCRCDASLHPQVLDNVDSLMREKPNLSAAAVDKMLSNSQTGYREILHERKSQSMRQASLLPYLTELHQSRNPSAVTAWNIEQPSTSKQEPIPAEILRVTEGSADH